MNEMTIAYIVLIAVALAGAGGVAYVMMPQQQFAPMSTGVFLLEDPVQTFEQPEPSCVAGLSDNCPNTYNPDQADSDGDGIGDACDDEFNPPPEELVCEGEESGQAQEVQPSQPLTGETTKEVSSSILPAVSVASLLILILAGIAYFYRDGIKGFITRMRRKWKR